MKKVWRNKWFILGVLVALFWIFTRTKVALAGTDIQLDKILQAGVNGLAEYFKFLLDVLTQIW